MSKFKKGNEVTLIKDTFDDDVNCRLSIQPQVITATKITQNGQWVRTNHYNDWIHFSYFVLKDECKEEQQLLIWSSMTWSEKKIYLTNCTFDELISLKKALSKNIWRFIPYYRKIEEEILKRLPEIREDKINKILK